MNGQGLKGTKVMMMNSSPIVQFTQRIQAFN